MDLIHSLVGQKMVAQRAKVHICLRMSLQRHHLNSNSGLVRFLAAPVFSKVLEKIPFAKWRFRDVDLCTENGKSLLAFSYQMITLLV